MIADSQSRSLLPKVAETSFTYPTDRNPRLVQPRPTPTYRHRLRLAVNIRVCSKYCCNETLLIVVHGGGRTVSFADCFVVLRCITDHRQGDHESLDESGEVVAISPLWAGHA